jgi:cell division protein FtsA
MVELAEEVLGLPARLGQPESVGGLVDVVKNPRYATGVGLVLYGFNHQPINVAPMRSSDGIRKLWTRTRNWFDQIF